MFLNTTIAFEFWTVVVSFVGSVSVGVESESKPTCVQNGVIIVDWITGVLLPRFFLVVFETTTDDIFFVYLLLYGTLSSSMKS
jgi:hypothetical protein